MIGVDFFWCRLHFIYIYYISSSHHRLFEHLRAVCCRVYFWMPCSLSSCPLSCFFFFSFLRHVPSNQFPTSVPRKQDLLIRHTRLLQKCDVLFYALLWRLCTDLFSFYRAYVSSSLLSHDYFQRFFLWSWRKTFLLHFDSGQSSKNATGYCRLMRCRSFGISRHISLFNVKKIWNIPETTAPTTIQITNLI